jgi:hypothetical protein
VVLGAGGCSFGPRALECTHGKYNESVKHVYEEQLLLNLVRLRYNDGPNRLDVSSIAAQYELTGLAQATPFFTAQAAMMSDVIRSFSAVLPGGQVGGANRPTVTLTPADDHETIKRFLTPVKPETLLFMAEAGWPVATVFRLYVDSLNGVPNAQEAGGPTRDIVPQFAEFQRVTQLLQAIHDQGYARVAREETEIRKGGPLPVTDAAQVNMVEAAKEGYEYRMGPVFEKEKDKDKQYTFVLVKHGHKLVVFVNPEAIGSPEIQELTHLLHLKPGLTQYEMKVEPPAADPPPGPREEVSLHLVPRSTIQALFYLSRGVAVPADHLKCGLAKATVGPDGKVFDWTEVTRGLFTVQSSRQLCRPKHAHVAVKYHGYWFYVDDRDQESKATFMLMQQLVRLDIAEKPLGRALNAPLLTLPAGR